MKLPAEPIKEELQKRLARGASLERLSRMTGVSSRTLLRLLEDDEVTVALADRLCLELGLHPAILWPRDWAA